MSATRFEHKDITVVRWLSSASDPNDCVDCEACNLDWDEAVNHYLQCHGYRLLWLGPETSKGLQRTTAVVGK